MVKGGGGAHTREKVVAAAAERFVVIASDDKLVDRRWRRRSRSSCWPSAHAATLRALGDAAVRAERRPAPTAGSSPTCAAPVGDPAALAARLAAVPGVVEHGLFPPAMTTAVIVGGPDGPARLAAPAR